MKKGVIWVWMGVLLWSACTKEETVVRNEPKAEEVSMRLSVNALVAGDPAGIGGDDTFGSLAIYLYDNDLNSTLLRSALLPSFASVGTKEIPVETPAGSKVLYVVANYVGKTFKLPNGSVLNLTATTSRQELESMFTESGGGFSSGALLMVGKEVMNITSADQGRVVNLILRRLQARVDVHVYKGANFGSDVVTLEYMKLHNQVLNSEVKFDAVHTPQMLNSPMLNVQTVMNSALLTPFTGDVLQPGNAQGVFYSYQNLVSVFSPLQVTAPYLEIKVNSNGTGYIYRGYLTDGAQVVHRYSLLQNNVYQVKAVLDIDSRIELDLDVLPWNIQNIEYGRPVTADDFSFGAWNGSWGGVNGKTMHTNVGGLEDAVFSFELKAPFGAAWAATLTNGLDFSFVSSTAGTSVQTVSKGFANPGVPAVIAVRASKKWTGSLRDTEFYITVEGKEIVINPVVGGQRRYEGTDTRIKIRQVASYN